MVEPYESADQVRERLAATARSNPFDGWTEDRSLKIALKGYILQLQEVQANSEVLFTLVSEIKGVCSDCTLRTRLYEVAGIPDPEERKRLERVRATIPSPAAEHTGTFDYHDDDCRCAFHGSFCNRYGHCWSCCGSIFDGTTGCTGGSAHYSAVSTGNPS